MWITLWSVRRRPNRSPLRRPTVRSRWRTPNVSYLGVFRVSPFRRHRLDRPDYLFLSARPRSLFHFAFGKCNASTIVSVTVGRNATTSHHTTGHSWPSFRRDGPRRYRARRGSAVAGVRRRRDRLHVHRDS